MQIIIKDMIKIETASALNIRLSEVIETEINEFNIAWMIFDNKYFFLIGTRLKLFCADILCINADMPEKESMAEQIIYASLASRFLQSEHPPLNSKNPKTSAFMWSLFKFFVMHEESI